MDIENRASLHSNISVEHSQGANSATGSRGSQDSRSLLKDPKQVTRASCTHKCFTISI